MKALRTKAIPILLTVLLCALPLFEASASSAVPAANAGELRQTLRGLIGLGDFSPEVEAGGSAGDLRRALRLFLGLETEATDHVHVWGAWAETAAATCGEPGREEQTCLLDPSHTRTRDVEGPPHSVVRVDEPKAGRAFYFRCLNCGTCFYDREAKEPIPAFPQVEAKPLQKDLTATLDAVMKKYDAVGAEAALIEDGLVTGFYSYGTADRTTGRQVDENAMYRVASISKLVTAMVFMTLKDRGFVDENADISDYFGYRCYNPGDRNAVVTPAMIMTHTAGLVNWIGNTLGYNALAGRAYFYTEPGTLYSYSNMGFGVIACICELATGRPFNELATEYLFDPAGVTATYVPAELEDTSNLAALYGYGGFPIYKMMYFTSAPVGANLLLGHGNLTIAAKDYAALLCVLLNGGCAADGTRVLSEESVAAILENRFQTDKYGVGFGVQIQDNVLDGRTVYVHTGSAYGMFSAFVFDPDTRSGAVVLTSGAYGEMDEESEVYHVCLEAIRAMIG